MISRWLTLKQACKYANLSKKTILKMIEDGHLQGDTTPGGQWRVDRLSIDEYFERSKKKVIAILESLGL